GRPQDQHLPYVPVALLGYASERLLAAARVLPRREAEKGGKIASRFEHARVRHAGCDHRSDELPDAGNLVQQPAHLILCMGAGDFLLQIVDRFVEPLKSLSQNLNARPGGVRKRGITFGQIEQLVDATYPLGGDNAEFRKMAAK